MKPLSLHLSIGVFFLLLQTVAAQEIGYTAVNGSYFRYMVDECGDTLILASLDDVSISSLRTFSSEEEQRLYRRYRRYAIKVYPYARQAIRIFRETEYVTTHMKKREGKRYIRKLQKELKDEFGEPLKKLSKTQGYVLFKMIERELDQPMHSLIKDLRGGFTASYWAIVAGLYGHKLRDGYEIGEDRVLDAVLDDFDISYELPNEPEQRRSLILKSRKLDRSSEKKTTEGAGTDPDSENQQLP